MNPTYYSLSDASTLLNVAPFRITYLLQTRRIPEPLRVGGRRLFTASDLTIIATVLDIELAITGDDHVE